MITITNEHFKRANKTLIKTLHNKLSIDKKILSQDQLLQMLSDSFFGCTYDEALKTRLTTVDKGVTAKQPSEDYIIVVYDAVFLLLQGDKVKSFEIWTGQTELYSQINKFQYNCHHSLNTSVPIYHLPKVLPDEPSNADIAALAKRFGYTSKDKGLYSRVSDASLVTINGMNCPYLLNDDHVANLEECLDMDEDPFEQIIWMPECFGSGSPDMYEFYFSLAEVCDAQLVDFSESKATYFVDGKEVTVYA